MIIKREKAGPLPECPLSSVQRRERRVITARVIDVHDKDYLIRLQEIAPDGMKGHTFTAFCVNDVAVGDALDCVIISSRMRETIHILGRTRKEFIPVEGENET